MEDNSINNKSEKISLDLNDLRVESFETVKMDESKVIAHDTGCFYLCDTGCDTAVCVYPTGGGTDF